MSVRSYLFVPGDRPERFSKALATAGFTNVTTQYGVFYKKYAAGTTPSGQAPPAAPITLMCGTNNPFNFTVSGTAGSLRMSLLF